MEVKTEADADCMILEYPLDDKPTVGMLFHSFVCLWFIVICSCSYTVSSEKLTP